MIASRTTSILCLCTLVLLFAACDSGGGGETIVLNANSPIPPVAEYNFTYSSDDASPNGVVEVQSAETDNLGEAFRRNGVSRSAVIRARVDSVQLIRRSGVQATTKVFPYLGGADVYLGTSTSGTHIGSRQFQTDNRSIALNVVTQDVTSIVQEESTGAFLQLNVSNPNDIPDTERVRVTVFYTVEFSG